MRDIFEKFPREDQNPGGGGTHPPLGVRRWIFTLGVRGLNEIIALISLQIEYWLTGWQSKTFQTKVGSRVEQGSAPGSQFANVHPSVGGFV